MTKEAPNLIQKLINLTNANKLRWEHALLGVNSAIINGWQFCTEMPQDDQPLLEICSPQEVKTALRGYGCGIEELNNAILNQYKRLGLYEYGTDYHERLKRIDEQRWAEEVKRAQDIVKLSEQFCKEF